MSTASTPLASNASPIESNSLDATTKRGALHRSARRRRNALKIIALWLLPMALALRDRRGIWLLYPASASFSVFLSASAPNDDVAVDHANTNQTPTAAGDPARANVLARRALTVVPVRGLARLQ